MTRQSEIKLLSNAIDQLKKEIPLDGTCYALERTKDLSILYTLLHREVRLYFSERKEDIK